MDKYAHIDKILSNPELPTLKMSDDELIKSPELKAVHLYYLMGALDDLKVDLEGDTSTYRYPDKYQDISNKWGELFKFKNRTMQVWEDIVNYAIDNKIIGTVKAKRIVRNLELLRRVEDCLCAVDKIKQMSRVNDTFVDVDIDIIRPLDRVLITTEEHVLNQKRFEKWEFKAKMVQPELCNYTIHNSNNTVDSEYVDYDKLLYFSNYMIDSSIRNLTLLPVERIYNLATRGLFMLESINISNGTLVIDVKAFSDHKCLKSVRLPNTLRHIAGGAFYNCKSLSNINLPDSLEIISGSAFDNTPWLKNVFKTQCELTYKDILVRVENKPMDYIVPDGISSISESAFRNCTKIRSVSLPSNLKVIPTSCFRGCHKLKSLTLPDSIQYIGAYAFYMCKSLQEINIPEGILEIAPYTFYRCDCLENIKFPSTLKSIGSYAFAYLYADEFRIPENVEFISDLAFDSCKISKLYMPKHCKICTDGSDYEDSLKIKSYDYDYTYDNECHNDMLTWNPLKISRYDRFYNARIGEIIYY